MIIVCAWCKKFLGTGEPFEECSVTHTMCPSCKRLQEWSEEPVLVVSRHRAHWLPLLKQVLVSVPNLQIVVDRRHQTPSRPPGPERRGAEGARSSLQFG